MEEDFVMSSPRNEFEQLMERLRTGDPDAAKELFERYGKAIHRVVRYRLNRRLRSQFDSLDFTQDAWASFFHIPAENFTFHTPEDLVAYLTGIVRHKMIDAYRKRFLRAKKRRLKFRRLQKIIDTHPAQQPSPSQFAIADDEWQRLLHNKPPKIQQALAMLRDGYSQQEIAQNLGLQVRRIHRLLARLKKINLP
jgi:RNA polymerase sigma-70 factor (ECF subfamily)